MRRSAIGKKDALSSHARPEHGIFAEVVPSDNVDWALFDMDAYGIDMGILLPSFAGTTNVRWTPIHGQVC